MVRQRLAPGADAHVLDCAARLFREHGFDSTTVRDIARAAGMLPGSLHYRYPTKGALLVALMRRGLAVDRGAIEAALDGVSNPTTRLQVALRTHIGLLLRRESASVVLYERLSVNPDARAEMVRLRDEYDAYWAGLLDDAHRAGSLGEGLDLKMLRLLLLGAANWTATWYSPTGDLTPDEIADAFWGCLVHGILPRPTSGGREG